MAKKLMFRDNCIGCGQCLEVCKHGALDCEGYSVKHNPDKCVSCFDCLTNVECSGDCFYVVNSDTVSDLKPRMELPMQSGEV